MSAFAVVYLSWMMPQKNYTIPVTLGSSDTTIQRLKNIGTT